MNSFPSRIGSLTFPHSKETLDRFARISRIARLIDTAFVIPGTRYRFGLNALIGALPGGGDLVLGMISVYLVMESRKLGVSDRDLARMLGNIVLEVLVGSIPVLGDIFDVALKANIRNLNILEQHLGLKQTSR